jgi:hypothetical protein
MFEKKGLNLVRKRFKNDLRDGNRIIYNQNTII